MDKIGILEADLDEIYREHPVLARQGFSRKRIGENRRWLRSGPKHARRCEPLPDEMAELSEIPWKCPRCGYDTKPVYKFSRLVAGWEFGEDGALCSRCDFAC